MKSNQWLNIALKKPGSGVHSVSTALPWSLDADSYQKLSPELDLDQKWILGIPSDCGAGMVRGANWGPAAIRKNWGKAPADDLGDIWTIPHFLYDELLNEAQIKKSQDVLYNSIAEDERKNLPVSPLSIAKKAIQEIRKKRNSGFLILGGDHSISWPVLDAILPEKFDKKIGILHFDAHTDLMQNRLGVEYCFATWAFHANQRIGRQKKLLQVGIRTSKYDQEYWEKKEDVQQIWSHEALKITPTELAKRVEDHFLSIGVEKIYISTDVDALDSKWMPACGTPEANGLHPDHIFAILDRIQSSPLEVLGSDVVELAPPLSLDLKASQFSIELASEIAKNQLALI